MPHFHKKKISSNTSAIIVIFAVLLIGQEKPSIKLTVVFCAEQL